MCEHCDCSKKIVCFTTVFMRIFVKYQNNINNSLLLNVYGTNTKKMAVGIITKKIQIRDFFLSVCYGTDHLMRLLH